MVMQTFTLDLALVLGPISAAEAALCKQLLNGLQLNLGTTVIVVVVVVFVPGESSTSYKVVTGPLKFNLYRMTSPIFICSASDSHLQVLSEAGKAARIRTACSLRILPHKG